MAKFRQVSPKIWNDAKFRMLSDNGKLVFFMLLTHPHTSSIGTLRAYYQGLAAELGWTVKAFQEAFQEALSKGMVKADERAGLIWLPNFTKYNLPQSPNVIKSWAGALDDCPECSLKIQIFQSIKSLSGSLSKAFQEAFQAAFGKGMPNQEQEQEQDIGTGIEYLSSGKTNDSVNQRNKPEIENKKMPDKSGSKENINPLDEKYINFARRFQNEVRINLNNTAPKITDKLIQEGAAALEMAVRIDCFDWNELMAALIWATTDNFWKQNLRSLASLRNKTRNGVTKIQEIVGRYRAEQNRCKSQYPRPKTFSELEAEQEKKRRASLVEKLKAMQEEKGDGNEL